MIVDPVPDGHSADKGLHIAFGLNEGAGTNDRKKKISKMGKKRNQRISWENGNNKLSSLERGAFNRMGEQKKRIRNSITEC